MRLVHISDTHGEKYHNNLIIPECDVLVHTGDIGGRTTCFELVEFLEWFNKQPAKIKIFIAGNHDLCLDKDYWRKEKDKGNLYGQLKWQEEYAEAQRFIQEYNNVVYLCNNEFIYESVKFYGSPISPSFHKEHWAFNADNGKEIMKYWGMIPSNVNVLLTHTPVYKVLDNLGNRKRDGEDENAGSKDLLNVIKKRLNKLQLHCSGHIHENVGIKLEAISNTRNCLFSNQAVISNGGEQLIFKPPVINI